VVDTGRAFIDRSRTYLTEDYLPKIRLAVEALSHEDLWWRPNPSSNSVGNLILHLAGNVRQWVVSGIGGAPDLRRREEEFNAREGFSGPELLAHLEEALEEVDDTLSRLAETDLIERRVIQGLQVTVMDALYHVVEHFSTHTGQILYISKLRTGRDLGFWEIKDGKAIPNW
jgi:uncharacterized damage-inducible protein DinB